jgi:hypothetical protein
VIASSSPMEPGYHSTVMQRPQEDEEDDDRLRRDRMNGTSQPPPQPYRSHSPTQTDRHQLPSLPSSALNGAPSSSYNNSYATAPPNNPMTSAPPHSPPRPTAYSDYQDPVRDKPSSNYYDPTTDSSSQRPSDPAWPNGHRQTSQVKLPRPFPLLTTHSLQSHRPLRHCTKGKAKDNT